MLLTIASGLIFTEMKINVLKLFSNIVRLFWNKWELRGMVLLSLFLQIVLIGLGSRRKYTASHGIAFLVWLTYLSADWMATVSLSTLLRGRGEINSVLVVFWAPFLLLHLGGPDTITAYALEDNELWLRYLLGLVIQFGVALYVYFSCRTNEDITFLAIPIFVAGFIKYGERIWILWSSSSKQFSQFLFSARARKPGKTQKKKKKSQPEFEGNFPTQPDEQGGSSSEKVEKLDCYLNRKKIIPDEARYLHEAYLSYKMFIPLFSDLTLRFYKDSVGIFSTLEFKSAANAFKVVETELGFLYDVLYTKMTILHTIPGAILRFICFLSYISAFVAFLVISGDDKYDNVDIAISYLLLVGAIFLDIYAAVAHVISNWAMFWLTNHKNRLAISFYHVIASLYVLIYHKRESRSIAQHNLIKFCLELKATKLPRIETKMFDTYKILETYTSVGKYWHTTWEDVKVDMKDFIFSHILDKYNRYKEEKWQSEFLKKLLSERGDHVLQQVHNLDFSETTIKLEFEHSLLVWHIATDLCYYDDQNNYPGTGIFERNGKISNFLSNYMLYLLVMRSDMMPKGISRVRYRDTCVEALKFFHGERNLDNSKAGMILLGLPGFRLEIPEFDDKSVLFDGIRLAKNLQLLATESRWDVDEKWEMISLVWVEMLTYAASHCGWKEHCQQLRRGGELLTLVGLLMAHFGLSTKIRFEDSHEDLKSSSSWNWESLDHLAYYLA